MAEQNLTKWSSQYICWDLAFHWFNSLAPGRFECDSKTEIFSLVLLIVVFRSSHDNALQWMPQDLTDDKSTLVQVMAWCRQATSHYLNQCWQRSPMPYEVTRPQWVKWDGILLLKLLATIAIDSRVQDSLIEAEWCIHMHQRTGSSLVQVMFCYLLGTDQSPQPICNPIVIWTLYINFHTHTQKLIWKCFQNGSHLVLTFSASVDKKFTQM